MAAANAEVWHSVEKKKKAPALEINSYHEAEMCHPSGLPAVRYVCNVCKDVACTSKLQLQAHVGGRKHKGAWLRLQAREAAPAPAPAPIASPVIQSKQGPPGLMQRSSRKSTSTTFCTICQHMCTSAEGLTLHNLGKTHAKNAAAFLAKHRHTGHHQAFDKLAWKCHVCDTFCTSQQQLQGHVKGMKHATQLAQLASMEQAPSDPLATDAPSERLADASKEALMPKGQDDISAIKPLRPQPLARHLSGQVKLTSFAGKVHSPIAEDGQDVYNHFMSSFKCTMPSWNAQLAPSDQSSPPGAELESEPSAGSEHLSTPSNETQQPGSWSKPSRSGTLSSPNKDEPQNTSDFPGAVDSDFLNELLGNLMGP